MNADEITEIAKATQEVAKTTRSGIEAMQGFGGFLSRVLGEPIEAAVGMFSDRLKFMRFERGVRLAARYNEIMAQRGLNSDYQSVPPKLALPIIEQATIEEDNELQDLWANLLASAHDPGLNGIVRTAFVDILKQMEAVDVRVLNFVYTYTLKINLPDAEKWQAEHGRDLRLAPIKYSVRGAEVRSSLRIADTIYECSVDNLIRLRCLAFYVKDIHLPVSFAGETASLVHDHNVITITSLGWNFVRACTMPSAKQSKQND
jgi:Abortive infection alpha